MTSGSRSLSRACLAAVDAMVYSRVNYRAKLATDALVPLLFVAGGLPVLLAAPAVGAGLLAGGFAGYGLIEYTVHRFILHGPSSILRRGHAQHHADPDAMISSPFFVTLLVVYVVWRLAALAFPAEPAALAVAGLYGGYAWYGVSHHLQHQRAALVGRLPLLSALERSHHRHHARSCTNFGISTTIWDRVFRTYESR